MAKFALNIGDNVKESLVFWLTKYLLYKTMVLNNSKANKEELQKAIKKTKPTPNEFEELLEVARAINKSGIGVYTLFYPAWLFAKDMAENPDIESLKDIDDEIVMQWLSIATSSKSEATKKNYKVSLQDFFNYLSKHNEEKYYFDIDLSKWQKNLKNALNKPPAFLGEKEVDLFISELDSFVVNKRKKKEVDPYRTALYRLLFKLALVSGLRVSELINLRIKDIEIEKKEDIAILKVLNSKGNKSRTIVIPYSKGKMAIKKELENYLEMRSCAKEHSDKLFCNEAGEQLSKTTIDYFLRRYLTQIGIKKEKMGMHLLRHTHATYFYSKTKDPVLLQERLGHSDPQTTRKYIHLEDEKVKKSVNALR